MPFSLLQSLASIPIAVVDTETTGASAAFGHKIIEIGIVRIENGRTVARYEQLIDPKRRITAGVTAFTGITQAMVQGKPRFGDQIDVLIGMLSGAAILGHNIRFDLSFLHAEFRRVKLEMKECLGPVPILDTVRIARRRFGRGGNALPVLSRRLGVDPIRSHRALAAADARRREGNCVSLSPPGTLLTPFLPDAASTPRGTGSARTAVAGRPPPSAARASQPKPDGPGSGWVGRLNGMSEMLRRFALWIGTNGSIAARWLRVRNRTLTPSAWGGVRTGIDQYADNDRETTLA